MARYDLQLQISSKGLWILSFLQASNTDEELYVLETLRITSQILYIYMVHVELTKKFL